MRSRVRPGGRRFRSVRRLIVRWRQHGSYRFEQRVIKKGLREDCLETRGLESLSFARSGVPRQRYGGDATVLRHSSDRRQALQAIDGTHADIQEQKIWLCRCKRCQSLVGTLN